MTSLLIIGGSGFFGKSFVDYYNLHSLKRWGIDNLYITSRKNQIINGVKTIHYNSQEFNKLPESDYIIYAASSTDQKTYKENFLQEIQDQKKAMHNFHHLVDSFINPPKKILYTSSGAVYGQSNLNRKRTNELKTQCEPDDNNSLKKVYANIKINWENYILSNFPENSIIARCFAFIGPRLPFDKHFAVGNFLGDFLNGSEINVNSKYSIYRSYLYCDDLVEWLMTLLVDSNKFNYKIFNVGSNEEVEIHDLANIFNKKLNNIINYSFDSILFERYVPDITLAKNIYNLRINNNLKNSVDKTINIIRN